MSFDLYLLPLRHEDDFDTAMSLLEALDRKDPSTLTTSTSGMQLRRFCSSIRAIAPFRRTLPRLLSTRRSPRTRRVVGTIQWDSTGAPMTASLWRSFISILTIS